MYKLLPKIQAPSGLIDAESILRIADNAFIPFDEANTDYQAYLAWVAKGNQPEPASN
jgi:hypothetical protein